MAEKVVRPWPDSRTADYGLVIITFLQGVSLDASPALATIGMSVRPSVRLSIRHTLVLSENDAS